MNKKYFVSYGDTNYTESLNRIGREAESLGLFDEVRLYSDNSLPEPFKGYTQRYKRGGGYWMWKPWVIHDMLERMDEGDIVVYADAGCTLLPHSDWNMYFGRLEKKDKEAIFFIAEGKNRRWCKRDVFSFFTPKDDSWKNANQIQATFFIVRKSRGNAVFSRWYDVALNHPELFIDVCPDDKCNEAPAFREHRHDQSVLTACVCTAPKLSDFLFMPEKMEKRYPDGQALLASRISATERRGVNVACVPQNRLVAFFNLNIVKPLQRFKTLYYFSRSRLLNR